LRRLSAKVRASTASGGLIFSPDGRWLAAAFYVEGQVDVWEVRTGALIRSLRCKWDGRIRSLAVSPDGKTLCVDGEGGARLYETATWGLRQQLEGHGVTRLTTRQMIRLDWSKDVGAVHVSAWPERAKLGRRTKEELGKLWIALGSDDAGKAFLAMRELLATPE